MRSTTLDLPVITQSSVIDPQITKTPSTTIVSQTISDTPHEEKKEEIPVVDKDQDNWVDYNDLQIHPSLLNRENDTLAIHKDLYETLGIIAFVTPYQPSTRCSAEEFVSNHSIKMGNIVYRYGERKAIEQEMKWNTETFATSDKLLAQLQKLADEKDPVVGLSSTTILQNTHGLFTIGSSPISYQPLILQNGIADDGSPDNFSLRIYPFVSKRSLTYPGKRFKKFTFSFLPFGADLHGKTMHHGRDFEETAVLTEAMNFPTDKIILQIPQYSASFFEQVQLQSLNLLILMMLRLGEKGFEAVCDLHYADYLLYAILLYLDEKISKYALNELLEKILTQKEVIEKELLSFFSSREVRLSFLSSLDNVFSQAKPADSDYATFFLSQLRLQDEVPDVERHNFFVLVQPILAQLALNDLSLVTIAHGISLDSIEQELLTILEQAQKEEKPVLFRREKRPYSTPSIEDDFTIYGNLGNDANGQPRWAYTKIPPGNVAHLCKLPFTEGVLLRCDKQFNQHLIDILKIGHAAFRPLYPHHMAIWNDFFRVVNEKNIKLESLDKFLNMANAVSITIATHGMSPYDVCSLEYASRRHAQEAQSFYTRMSDSILTQPYTNFIDYNRLKLQSNPHYHQKISLSFPPVMPQPCTQFPTDHYYPNVFLISVFDLCIGKNSSDNSNNNTAFYFKDTINKSALNLAKRMTFFGNASKNGALKKDDPRRTMLKMR